MTLRERIDEYLEEVLLDYKPVRVLRSKVIHDTILGTNVFYPHEVAILDLPILQRLRRICQVDVVSLVFPSSNHNRFEHTLGVTVIADKMIRSLIRKPFGAKDHYSDDYLLNHVRLAAIMHDCGHGPFSHMSEQIYGDFSDLLEVKESDPKFIRPKPHEILSYLIVTSKVFKDFFYKEIYNTYEKDINSVIDLDLVGNMIIGWTEEEKYADRAFLIDVINGAFDADKLDYLQRDSYFTGLKMVLDLDRLFHTIDVMEIENKTRLVLQMGGVLTLEQIIFNKMMLTSTVYHHQKVRAAECLFASIFYERISEYSSAATFLKLTDDDIYCIAKEDSNKALAPTLARDLCNRKLPKRALVISPKTCNMTYDQLREAMDRCNNKNDSSKIIKAISDQTEKMGLKVPKEFIWMDFRPSPDFKEASQCPVKNFETMNGYTPLSNIFPIDAWTRAFEANKWQGYVYSRPEYTKMVNSAAKVVFSEIFGLELNDLSTLLCKMDALDDELED